MRVRHLPGTRARRGFALFVAILAALAAASAASLMMSYASTSNRMAAGKRAKVTADFLADGAIERVRWIITEATRNGIPPEPEGTVLVDGTPVEYELATLAPTQVIANDDGLQTFVTRYRIDANATVAGFTSFAHRLVLAEAIPIFQFALFYENDLELWPGPDMTVSGRIHSNANIYLGAESTLSLDTNYVRCAGDFFLRRKHSNDVANHNVEIRRWVADPWDAFEPREMVEVLTRQDLQDAGVPSVSGYDSDFDGFDDDGDGDLFGPDDWLPFAYGALERWSQPDFYAGGEGSTLKTGDMGFGRANAPELKTLAMFEPSAGGDYRFDPAAQKYVPVPEGTGTHARGPFHAEAGLSILSYVDGTWAAFDSEGDPVTDEVALVGAVHVTDLYDARQANGGAGRVDVAVVDVEKLREAGLLPNNGLLYLGAHGADEGLDAKGFQLENGSELGRALTVASENSVYVKGDYNTENKQSAAILADAVNLLSNEWDNSKTHSNGIPPADETVYNFAMVTGNIDSTSGNYNGGVENLPRFHEDWSGITCRLDGSIACLGTSRYATGNHSGVSNLRRPPVRDWNYDPLFNDLANMPPFTPTATTVSDLVSW